MKGIKDSLYILLQIELNAECKQNMRLFLYNQDEISIKPQQENTIEMSRRANCPSKVFFAFCKYIRDDPRKIHNKVLTSQ